MENTDDVLLHGCEKREDTNYTYSMEYMHSFLFLNWCSQEPVFVS